LAGSGTGKYAIWPSPLCRVSSFATETKKGAKLLGGNPPRKGRGVRTKNEYKGKKRKGARELDSSLRSLRIYSNACGRIYAPFFAFL
jgi:hypothetical protein